MDFSFLNIVFELIDMRSFSNLWFWIALAVMWSTTSHWVIGVPFDMINRARHGNEVALADVEILSGIYSRRTLFIVQASGVWIVGATSFGLTGLWVAGFSYGTEICQAVFLLALPLSLVGLISVYTARRVVTLSGLPLLKALRAHRVKVQLVGIVSIFVTSLWGMWTNMNVNVLGH